MKTLNTVTAWVMVNPGQLPEDTAMFICGSDSGAKAEVAQLLTEGFGWKTVIDLGDIHAARGMEMYLLLWIQMMGVLQTPLFNIRIVRGVEVHGPRM